MKKVAAIFLLLACMLVGCGQKETIQEVTPTPTQNVTPTKEEKVISIIQTVDGGLPTPTLVTEQETDELVFVYDKFLGYVYDMAIADNGTLYAICCWQGDKQYSKDNLFKITQPQQSLYAFDENGTCLWRMEMMFPTGDLFDAYQIDEVIIIEWADGFLYAVLPQNDKTPVLYQLNLETREWKEFYCFDTFSKIKRLVFMGDRLYVYGILENPKEKPLVQNLEYLKEYPNMYKGEAIGYIDLKNRETDVTLLPIDVPKDMIKLAEDTLGIYQMGEDASYFWKYTPEEEIWEKTNIAVSYHRSTLEESLEKSPWCQEFVGYEDGCIYLKNAYDICYETADGKETTLLTNDRTQYLNSDGIFLYFYTHIGNTKKIQRIRISDLFDRITEETE